jgi:1,2-phenylacetyl-CoA epoxidase PaaB subunit
MRFFVFARRAYERPLHRCAAVEAPDADAAAGVARERFGDWLEVRLVPESSVRWIVGPLPAERVPEEEREEVAA